MPALRRHALGLLHNSRDADNLLHDCLLSALEGLHAVHRNDDVRAWLFAKMYSVLHSRKYRKVRRTRRTQLRREDETELPCPHASEDDKLLWRNLLRGLNSLTLEQRAVFLLVSIEEFPYPEAARILRIPLRRVMSRLNAGREQLRKSMEV
jgi:RNA polymerase sigma-70 factor (ECF subfamily)